MDMDMDQTGARAVIQSLVAHLSLSMLYPFFFEDIYVNNTRQYFAAERSKKQVTLSPSDYVLHCATRLEQEELRLSQCCPEFSWGTVTRAVEDTLIRNDTQTLAAPGTSSVLMSLHSQCSHLSSHCEIHEWEGYPLLVQDVSFV
jgi:Cullin family